MRRLLNTLYATTQGTWLSLDGDCIVVNFDRETSKKYPIHILESVVCFGRVNATPPVMGFCASRGVPISFFSENGRFLARVDGPVRGNVLLRRQQYRLADDPVKSADIARNILAAKIFNSRNVLLRFAREASSEDGTVMAVRAAARYLSTIAGDMKGEQSADVLRGREGDAARCYFGVFDHLIVGQKEGFQFIERRRRPPTDPVNAMLSFVYSLLAHDVTSALEGVGLDPAVGFLHRDRPGRPSLALDLMEEFRACLADRLVLSLINRRQVDAKGFVGTESGAIEMTAETKRMLIAAWQERKQGELTHPYIEEKMKMGFVPHIQARLLARHIRGDLEQYPPFAWK